MTNHKTVTLIAPVGEPGKRVRLAKVIRILSVEYECDVHFLGWQRLPEESLGAAMQELRSARALLRGGGYRSAIARAYYILWMVKVFFYLILNGPTSVYCLGLETALPVWFASVFRRRIRYVFDDADRLVLLWKLPASIKAVIAFLERRVSKAAQKHVIPTFERYDYRNDSMLEVANMPEVEQVKSANQLASHRVDGRFHVYVNGWLDDSRGLSLVKRAAEILLDRGVDNIVFDVAVGRLTGDGKEFLSLSNVCYLGSLTHIESLAHYRQVDVVVTFYDPKSEINRFALPNKWGDAIAMGTPVIVNRGVRTAQPLVSAGAAFLVDFYSPEELADLLIDLAADESRVSFARDAIKNIAPNYLPFGAAMEPALKLLVR